MKKSNYILQILLGVMSLGVVCCDLETRKVEVENVAVVTDVHELPEQISFNEHVQPILSEYCYHCHGPDAGTREPKDDPLRLDRPEDAFSIRESLGMPAMIKGDAKASMVVKRMHSKDVDSIMPPPASHKKMMPREIALLERWIEQGAVYEPHWSFGPIVSPEVPQSGSEWSANPIDRFVFEKLDAVGLAPNPEDRPGRFHRRMTLDLTGLPPSPEETKAFEVAYGKNPDAAVAAEADRLLATMASAEHFTRHWLDVARYADTHGIHIDNRRSIWPYRDWVIRAFHDNMAWDQFTLEQIAGDMLPNRTLDQHVASGFNRCLSTTGEGGAIAEEYEAIYATDRVDTMSAAWLGLTTSCAACHDHKFDPISTKEFYSLTAFFRNNTMKALDGNSATHAPAIFVPIPEDRQRHDELKREQKAVEAELAARRESAKGEFEQWLMQGKIEGSKEIDSSLELHLPLDSEDGVLRGWVTGEAREWQAVMNHVDGPLGKAPILSGHSIEVGDVGSFGREDSVTWSAFLRVEGSPKGAILARMDPKQSHRGWDFYLENGKPAAHVIDSWDQAASKMVGAEPLKSGVWQHVAVVFRGANAGHQVLELFVDGKLAKAGVNPNSVGGNIEANVPLRLGSREGGDRLLTDSVAVQDLRFYRKALSAKEIKRLANRGVLVAALQKASDQRTEEELAALLDHFVSNVDEKSKVIQGRLDSLSVALGQIEKRGSMSLVMEEKKDGEAFAYVLTRGVYSDKGEKVSADTPAILPPMAADLPRNRLGLAHWLNDPKNPLPARVTMNRTWYYFFGSGIVETSQDFGIMGARPSHPKLLDWLASEFIARKWNYREMLKQIVTSATYRQSGALSPEKLELDPSNTLLSRGPRVRLDAEQIRDLALATAGSLSPRVGGAPVMPYQPEGIWEAVAMPQSNTRTYRQDRGENLYRRSLYTFWKRTAAPPAMEILNAPSREVSCVKRDRTNTPLQALVLLNDPQFVEAARELAIRAIRASDQIDLRIDFMTERLISRRLNDEEKSAIRDSYEKIVSIYEAQPDEAERLVAVGDRDAPSELDRAELAAWSLIASQIFNLDETITR